MTLDHAAFQALLQTLVIEKRGYSRNPWRAVTPAGQEVCGAVTFDHPDLGPIVINEPIMGRTKRACAERLAAVISEYAAAEVTPVNEQEGIV